MRPAAISTPSFPRMEFSAASRELAALARTQYTLGYYSHLPVMDEKYRILDVRVLRPNLDVVAKKGYYPTATNLSR